MRKWAGKIASAFDLIVERWNNSFSVLAHLTRFVQRASVDLYKNVTSQKLIFNKVYQIAAGVLAEQGMGRY